MTICKRLAPLVDYLQEAGPSGWSFARDNNNNNKNNLGDGGCHHEVHVVHQVVHYISVSSGSYTVDKCIGPSIKDKDHLAE